jgi:hypothetical protein
MSLAFGVAPYFQDSRWRLLPVWVQ